MRVVQALHWLHDMPPADQDAKRDRFRKILWNPAQGAAMRADLRNGLDALPQWMRETVEALLSRHDRRGGRSRESATRP